MTGGNGRDSTSAERIRVLRDRLIEAALPHVPFDGWSEKALLSAAADIGLERGDVHAAFADPPRDSVRHFAEWTDRRMLARLDEATLDGLKIREVITLAVQVRLEELAAHREAVRHAFGFLSLPGNHALGVQCLCRTVDEIWHAAGDASTDFSYYTKRGLLAAVLGSTMLYWLEDRSEEYADTRAFLDRRIGDVMLIPKLRGRIQGAASRLAAPCRSMFRRATRAS